MEISSVAPISTAPRSSPDIANHGDAIGDVKSIPRTVEIPLELPDSPVGANEALAAELRGRVMEVPNMMRFMDGWPHRERNKHYEEMRDLFDQALDRVIPDPKRRQKFKECDFALFSALLAWPYAQRPVNEYHENRWWPHAEWDDFYSAAFFALWIFVWDDTMDAHDHDISDDFEKGCRFRQQTIEYVKHCLGLRDETEGEEPKFPSLACGLFKDFSGRVVEKFKRDRIQRIFDEIVRYIHECEVEQADRLAGYIPTLDEYLNVRLGTSAVFILCGIFELFLEAPLPDWMMNSPEMEVIWRETNLGIIIINDILSLKKEMTTDCLISLVPVLYRAGINWDDVVPELMEELQAVRNRLDEAAEQLERAAKRDPDLLKDLKTYVDVCKTSTTGTYIYTIESKRYKIAQDVREDGSVTIVL